MSRTLRKIHNFFDEVSERGFDALNDLFPSCWEYADVYSERVKSALLFVGALSLVMMVTAQKLYPNGWLYTCIPRPFTALILFLHNINIPDFPTPEYGMHWLTLFVYVTAFYLGIVYMESQGINKPFHKIAYCYFLFLLTFYTPFEWIYITLVDIFHNIPVYGYPAIWMFGWWKDRIGFMLESVIGMDGGITIATILGMYVVKKDLDNYIPTTNIKFDKISKIFLIGFLWIMCMWVLLPFNPIFSDVQGHPRNPDTSIRSKMFPQTIYVHYGYFEDYNMPIPPNGDTYGIVEEYWFPNDIIKYHNHISKLFSVAFMFYTFIPRVKKD